MEWEKIKSRWSNKFSNCKHFYALATISTDRKKLQEAMFEVITSEASYLKSLNILIWHFAQSAKLIGDPPYVGGQGVIGKRDHRILFSDVIAVRPWKNYSNMWFQVYFSTAYTHVRELRFLKRPCPNLFLFSTTTLHVRWPWLEK